MLTNYFEKLNSGDVVNIKCPVYKNGRTFTGVIKREHGKKPNAYYVLINGNKKASVFSGIWLKKKTI